MSSSSIAGSVLGFSAPMTGATSTTAGTAGSAPAPAAGDQNKALLGSGAYGDVAGADSIQTLTATGVVTEWASMVLVNATSGNVVVTLPAASGNLGKTVKVVKTDATSNTVTVAANGADTMNSLVSLVLGMLNETLTVEAATSTSVRVVHNLANAVLAEFGAVEVANQVFSTGTFVNSTNGVYALPSAGTWRLTYDLATDGTGANASSQVAIHSPTATVISGSERTRGGSVTTAQALTCTVLVTTTGAANYTLVGRHGGSGTMTISNSATNQSNITWQKIGGFTPVSGQIVDYLAANVTANSNISATVDLTLVTNTIRGNLAYNAPYITLLAGKTYEMMASFTADIDATDESETLTISWVDATNTSLPNQNSFTYNNDFGVAPGNLTALETVDPLAYCVITPLVDTQVKLRATEGSVSNLADVNSGWVTIKQLGSSAVTAFTGATSTLPGTSGFVPAPAAGDNAKLLCGDGTFSTALIDTRTLTSGTSYVPTSGTNRIVGWVIGGGGGGGNCASSISTLTGGGGAAGGVVGFLEDVSDQTTYTYAIGPAGTASNNGGATTITVNGNVYTGNGGGAGTDGTTAAPSTTGGGIGGTTVPTSASGNAFHVSDGGNGFAGFSVASNCHVTGAGGGNMFCQGGRSTVTNTAGSAAGIAPLGGGFGGGGAGSRQNDTTAVSGGAGKIGGIIIFEYR